MRKPSDAGKPKADTMSGWVRNWSARWNGMQGGGVGGGFIADAGLSSLSVRVFADAGAGGGDVACTEQEDTGSLLRVLS